MFIITVIIIIVTTVIRSRLTASPFDHRGLGMTKWVRGSLVAIVDSREAFLGCLRT